MATPKIKLLISLCFFLILLTIVLNFRTYKKPTDINYMAATPTPTISTTQKESAYPNIPYFIFNYFNKAARLYLTDLDQVPTFTNDIHVRQKLSLEILHDPQIYTIYEVSTVSARGFETIQEIYPSPDGQYLYLGLTGYEWSGQRVIHLPEGRIVHFPDDILFSSSDLIWSPNNEFLIVQSYHDAFGGEGTPGLFVSDYGNREKLNKVLTFSENEYNFCGRSITNVSLDSVNNVIFEDVCENCNGKAFSLNSDITCPIHKNQKYSYNPKTKILTKINE